MRMNESVNHKLPVWGRKNNKVERLDGLSELFPCCAKVVIANEFGLL